MLRPGHVEPHARRLQDARLCDRKTEGRRSSGIRGLVLLALASGLWLALSVGAVAVAAESFRLVPGVNSLFGMESAYVWLSGSALIPAGGRPGSGTLVNVADELGVDQGEATGVILRSVILETHLLNFDLLMLTPSAVKTVRNTFVFHNKTYSAGTVVETKLDFTWMRLGYGYRVQTVAGLTLAPRTGVHYIQHGIMLNAQTKEAGMVSNSRRLDGTYPVIGLETRYQFPFGLDLGLELEGIHLITRGFLTLAALSVSWQAHPDVILSLGCYHRAVHYVEDHQPLNNEWFYSMLGVTAGVSFTF